jgi:poly-gamma-glutamate synthase PgsB/CapB
MGRLTLASLFKSKQQRRIEAETFDPTTAPHRPLVSDIVLGHLPPLQIRLRSRLIDDLVLRILEIAPAPEPLWNASALNRRVLLGSRAQQAVLQLVTDMQYLERRFDSLSSLLRETEDEEEQRLLMAEYLTQTVSSPRKLRKDIKALRRFLGYDALRERHDQERRDLLLCIELGVRFVAGVVEALADPETTPDATPHVIPSAPLPGVTRRTAPRVAPEALGTPEERSTALAWLCSSAQTERFLGEVLGKNDRWQTRLAAAEGLARLCQWARDSEDEPISAETRAELLAVAVKCISDGEEHAWVRAKSLEIALAVHPERGEQLLLEGLRGKPVQNDFLFRRLALDQIVRAFPTGRAATIFDALIEPPEDHDHVRLGAIGISRPEPSEHVRMGLACVVLELPPGEAIPRLRRLAGLDGHDETSPKVRAQASISARKLAAGAIDLAVREAASTVLVDVLATETHPMPLKSACNELAALARELAELGADEHLQALAPAWVAALRELVQHPRCSAPIAEVAAAAAERIDRERFSDRRLATKALRDVAATVPLGGSRTVRLSRLPKELARRWRDPGFVGRVLADLSRDDFGLGIRLGRRTMTIWRGDRMRRRVWRILHELRHPAPSKRQAFLHTIGRTYRGLIRAHPGRLDEETATTVPGERVLVESEGSWGRHLPTVDDVLDLPLFVRRPVQICSTHGVATLTPSRSFFRRLHARLAISWRYPAYVALRQGSITSDEPQQRRRFLERMAARFDIDVRFEPYREDPGGTGRALALNPTVASLFPARALEQPRTALAVAAATLLGPLDAVRDWLESNLPYFTSMAQNNQTALAAFLAVAAIQYVSTAYVKRRHLERARASFALSIGGWGTRGKSGTERIKAALFHGLGFDVFVKTTGCEAMMLHAPPTGKPLEIFVYRPYDKATIWEQYNLALLARRLGPDVFLWECMALNPRYVNLLEHDWMRDDMVTLTNAYPDHEDIQGPAGINVAQVISQYIPKNSTLFTSEVNFLPLFAEVCRERKTRMFAIGERDGDLIANDVLAIFPYNEHPRNIALVSQLAQELGIDPTLAMVAMAENVIADLGVLKTYPMVRVRGRIMWFVNGCSANERTGCLNSWRRMNLDKIDAENAPEDLVISVVNNRADRIARSEVFARVIVRDVDVDRHVLIGTNIKGLLHFIETALGVYLSEIQIVQAEDLTQGDAALEQPRKRLRHQLGRLRIPVPTTAAAMRRLEVYAGALNSVIDEGRRAELEATLAKILAPDREASVSMREVLQNLTADRGLTALLDSALVSAPAARSADDLEAQMLTVETVEPATHAEVIEHFLRQLAIMVVRSRLEARLERVLEQRNPGEFAAFDNTFRASWREIFEEKVIPIHNSEATGDQIIDLCARATPPGTKIRIFGMQNIKGTGLDFVYRWVALDTVVLTLRAQQSERSDRRVAALRELEAFEDHGVYDSGLALGMLAMQPIRQPGPEEIHLRDRVRSKLEAVYARRVALLRTQTKRDSFDQVAGVLEGGVDYLDAVLRYRASRRIMDDLAERRISHGRAALEMRTLVGRQKGGWLAKSLRKRWKLFRRES